MLIKLKKSEPTHPGISLLAQAEKADSIEDLKAIVIKLVKAVYPIKLSGVPDVE